MAHIELPETPTVTLTSKKARLAFNTLYTLDLPEQACRVNVWINHELVIKRDQFITDIKAFSKTLIRGLHVKFEVYSSLESFDQKLLFTFEGDIKDSHPQRFLLEGSLLEGELMPLRSVTTAVGQFTLQASY